MLPTIADVAAAIEADPHPDHRAELAEFATVLLRLGIVRWEIAQLRAFLCRQTVDARAAGGDDDGRDAAAA